MKLKVLVFTDSFAPHTQTFVYDDVIGLSCRHEVLVACFNRLNPDRFPYEAVVQLAFKESWVAEKIRVRQYRFNLRMDFANRTFSRQLNDLIRQFRPDVIHCHFGVNALKLVDNIEGKLPPLFVNFHGKDASQMIKRSKIYRRRLRALFQKDCVFPTATSRSLLCHLEKNGIRSPNSRCIYSGIDPQFFKRSGYEKKDEYVTFIQVAAFREKKGHYFTVLAFRKLMERHPELKCRLQFVGDGALRPAIRRLCRETGIGDRVAFNGWADSAEIREHLENASVFVHHSIIPGDGDMESTTVAIMEAMSMELPVLATFHSGIPELVENGVNGYLVPERDVEAYANRMFDVISWGFVPENRRKIIAQFSRSRRMETLEKSYYQAIAQVTGG